MAFVVDGVHYIAFKDTSTALKFMPYFNMRTDYDSRYDFVNMGDHKDGLSDAELNEFWNSAIKNTSAVDVKTVLSYIG